MKPEIKGGLIAEAILFIIGIIIVLVDSWGFIFFVAFWPFAIIPAFLLGFFIGKIYGKKKEAKYHLKWMIGCFIASILLYIPQFLIRYGKYTNDIRKGIERDISFMFTLNNMPLLLFYPFIICILIFIIAIILFIITKIKENDASAKI